MRDVKKNLTKLWNKGTDKFRKVMKKVRFW